MKHFIYLLEFRDGSYYIGQTVNLKRRINQHYATHGTTFNHCVIDECDSASALLIECMWIQSFLTWNLKVRNGKPWRNVNFNQKILAGIKKGPLRTIKTIQKAKQKAKVDAIPKEHQLKCPNCKIIVDMRDTKQVLTHNVFNKKTFIYECLKGKKSNKKRAGK